MPPERILNYAVNKELGQGQYSITYLAKDYSSGAKLVIRSLEPELFLSTEAYEQFRHQIESLLEFEHSSLAKLLACHTDATKTHLVREFIEGRSLKELARTAPISYESFLELAPAIARGLKAIHERATTFSRLHMGNIFIDSSGCIKLVDFGVPLPAESENPYVGWTQLELEQFHLGMIFHELLSGQKRPVGKPDNLAIDLPGEARLLIKKLLATDPEDRFTSDDELVVTLDEMSRAHVRSGSDEPTGKREPARLYLLISLLTLLLLLLWIIVSMRH